MFNWHDTSVRQLRAHVLSGIHSMCCFNCFTSRPAGTSLKLGLNTSMDDRNTHGRTNSQCTIVNVHNCIVPRCAELVKARPNLLWVKPSKLKPRAVSKQTLSFIYNWCHARCHDATLDNYFDTLRLVRICWSTFSRSSKHELAIRSQASVATCQRPSYPWRSVPTRCLRVVESPSGWLADGSQVGFSSAIEATRSVSCCWSEEHDASKG